jgi:DNA-binding CsgD family transcriptional regulator
MGNRILELQTSLPPGICPSHQPITGYQRARTGQRKQLREPRRRAEASPLQQSESPPLSKVLPAAPSYRDQAVLRLASLTPRQREIMERMLVGQPNKAIAWECRISQRTVENHRAAIMHKTGSRSLPALTCLALAAAWNDRDAFVQRLAGLTPGAAENTARDPRRDFTKGQKVATHLRQIACGGSGFLNSVRLDAAGPETNSRDRGPVPGGLRHATDGR